MSTVLVREGKRIPYMIPSRRDCSQIDCHSILGGEQIEGLMSLKTTREHVGSMVLHAKCASVNGPTCRDWPLQDCGCRSIDLNGSLRWPYSLQPPCNDLTGLRPNFAV